MSFSIWRYIIYVDTHLFLCIFQYEPLFIFCNFCSCCFLLVLVFLLCSCSYRQTRLMWTSRVGMEPPWWKQHWMAIQQSASCCWYKSASIKKWMLLLLYIHNHWHLLIHVGLHGYTFMCWKMYNGLFHMVAHLFFHKNINVYIWMYESVYICMHIQSCMYLDGLSFHCIGIFVWVHWLFTLFSITLLYDCIYVFM